MSEYSGACIDEQRSPMLRIEHVETAVAAFVGHTAKGPTEPVLVSSWAEFTATFGAPLADGSLADGYLADCVNGYFLNGGTKAYIVRIGPSASGTPLTLAGYVGDRGLRRGLGGLETVTGVTMVCAPDLWAAGRGEPDTPGAHAPDTAVAHQVQNALIAHCERMADRIAILDAPPGLNARQAYAWRVATTRYDSAFAVLYYPWLKVLGAGADAGEGRAGEGRAGEGRAGEGRAGGGRAGEGRVGEGRLVPPCGHLAGVWARCDASRGVPTPSRNEVVRGVIGVGVAITRAEHELLDPVGVNCVRAFLGRGVRVWGARTLANDPVWADIRVRRIVNHVQASVRQWLSAMISAPVDAQTQARSIRSFLFQLWLDGGLVGHTVDEAFQVHCEELRSDPAGAPDGVSCEIKIAPTRPSSFVVLRLDGLAG